MHQLYEYNGIISCPHLGDGYSMAPWVSRPIDASSKAKYYGSSIIVTGSTLRVVDSWCERTCAVQDITLHMVNYCTSLQ